MTFRKRLMKGTVWLFILKASFLSMKCDFQKAIYNRDSLSDWLFMLKVTFESPFLFNEMRLSQRITKRDSLVSHFESRFPFNEMRPFKRITKIDSLKVLLFSMKCDFQKGINNKDSLTDFSFWKWHLKALFFPIFRVASPEKPFSVWPA